MSSTVSSIDVMRMVKPDFFIVGAPKCGTTAMYEYLRQHPEIFMPAEVKEPNFFSADIHRQFTQRPSLEQYLALFAPAMRQKRKGEASVWYLYSKEAARKIKEFNPEARIIIMLRNPADMLYALHSELLFCVDEDIADFDKALAAEEDRKITRFKPSGGLPVECLFYGEIGKYSEQVRRYYDLFGRERVHVVIFDDLKCDPEKVYREVLHFLEVSQNFQPDFKIVNPNKAIRSMALHRFLFYSPHALRRIVRTFLPDIVRFNIRMKLRGLNSKPAKRPLMDGKLRLMLQTEFSSDINALSALIGRDLSHWSR